jgi:tetratricopeptide (TPR) repeat protein
MQKKLQPDYPLLYSLWGYRYCDLLLDRRKYQEVLSRAEKFFEWRRPSDSLLDIALDHLSLGRAHLLQALQEGTGDYTQAESHLTQAVDFLRAAGHQDDLPGGLLAWAALRRSMGDTEQARADLDEAATIAERGGMRLFEADCHLEYARLHLATAKATIEEMGYHRRGGEVVELEGALNH